MGDQCPVATNWWPEARSHTHSIPMGNSCWPYVSYLPITACLSVFAARKSLPRCPSCHAQTTAGPVYLQLPSIDPACWPSLTHNARMPYRTLGYVAKASPAHRRPDVVVWCSRPLPQPVPGSRHLALQQSRCTGLSSHSSKVPGSKQLCHAQDVCASVTAWQYVTVGGCLKAVSKQPAPCKPHENSITQRCPAWQPLAACTVSRNICTLELDPRERLQNRTHISAHSLPRPLTCTAAVTG